MTRQQASARKWFEAAVRSYVESHQGCPWCGGSHRVYLRKDGARVTYSCHSCDFHVAHDEGTGEHSFIPGEQARGPARSTQLDLPVLRDVTRAS
jgi:hypothetical protein